ncbi:MAG: amidohydrolase family protein [Ginsengibacter sp.]
MKQVYYYLLLPFILVSVLPSIISAQTADCIFTNGKIFTSDTNKLYVQALAIKGNKIIATGTNDEIIKLGDKRTKKIDITGKTIVPGFNDAHDHPGWLALIGKFFNQAESSIQGLNKSAVIDSVALMLKQAKPGEWIHGLIGTDILFDTSMRATLDSLAPDNPLALQIWWGHGTVLNKRALKKSGLSDDDRDPVGGWYIRNSTNKISALQENAQAPLWIAMNESEPVNVIKGLRSFSQEQLSVGITSVQFMGTGLNAKDAQEEFGKANLSQRIRIMKWQRTTPAGRQASDWDMDGIKSTPLFTISGVKYLIDGTPFEGNSLHKQASLRPGEKNGRLDYPIDTMKQIFKEALTSNDQLMMHIAADSSFEVALSLIQKTASAERFYSKRIRVEHNCVGPISDAQKAILKNYNILMMHTPKYCQGSPLRSLYNYGVVIGISPDGTTNPFFDIMMCTSMQSDPAENLTREQAVIAYTKNNAYAEFKEKEKGTLMPGMLADLAVLSQDIFTIPAGQLPATKSVLTMINGKIVYEDKREDRQASIKY